MGPGKQKYPEDRPPTTEERRALWDERYATEGWVFGVEANRFVVDFFATQPPGRLLDLGCGQGRNAVWLADAGYDVLGLDLSPVAIEQARRLAAEAGVAAEFAAVDLANWEPEPDAFDYALLSYLQLHPQPRRKVHRAVERALKRGGTVFLVAHHLDNMEHGFGGPQLPDVLFTEGELETDFAGLDVVRSEAVERLVETDDGTEAAIDIVFVGTKRLD